MSREEPVIVPVILAGGSGTRLWPASTQASPKQYLPLLGEEPLIRNTYHRVASLAGDGGVRVVTVRGHAALVGDALPEVPRQHLFSEPQGRNTGPSIAWTLHELQRDHAEDVAVFFPADHIVRDHDRLRRAVRDIACQARESGRLGLLGIVPTRPETGYGYMQAAPGTGSEGWQVTRFIEKPDAGTAEALWRRDGVFWNSGIFAIPVAAGLEIVRDADDDLGCFLQNLPHPGTGLAPDSTAYSQTEEAFGQVRSVAFDKAVVEQTQKRFLLPLDAGWSDLGSWQAIWQESAKDDQGNVLGNTGRALDSSSCLVASDGARISVVGVQGLVVVSWGDEVLVCPLEKSQDVRQLAREQP